RLLAPLVDAAVPAIQLGTVVRRIEWSRGEVRVHAEDAHGRGQSFSAAACIITLPLGVLHAPEDEPGAVTFDPPLPASVRTALGGLVMGSVIRMTFLFDDAFWAEEPPRTMPRGADLRRLSFLHLGGRPWSVFWTQSPLRLPLLTA